MVDGHHEICIHSSYEMNFTCFADIMHSQIVELRGTL